MSQMPDKIWVQNTKYNTEEVCGYQYKFAQEIECKGIENFIEYVPANAFIEKACEWIKYNTQNGGCLFDGWEEDFKKYMEE